MRTDHVHLHSSAAAVQDGHKPGEVRALCEQRRQSTRDRFGRPLPNDLLAMVKRGASVEVDYQTTGAKVVATFPDGAVEEISVEFG